MKYVENLVYYEEYQGLLIGEGSDILIYDLLTLLI